MILKTLFSFYFFLILGSGLIPFKTLASSSEHPALKSDYDEMRELHDQGDCCDKDHDHKIKDAIGTQACQRKAVIGSREYVIDILSTKKGEGLRYTMKSDPFALELLEKYQADSDKIKYAAYTGTPSLILMGWRISSADSVGKDLLFWVGVTGVLGSYLWGKLLNNSNEKTLQQAISVYNENAVKRNSPVIDVKEAE